MSAKLILATGSHAGIEEPLRHGYYMVGRDHECQIRPKSRSVSRRHCLLHHSKHGLRVFDLASANGTRVNDSRLEPNQWLWLNRGDSLRCGKVVFSIDVDQHHEVAENAELAAAIVSSDQSHESASPNAWQNFDVASFLEAEDEAERRQRYASIRNHAVPSREDREISQDHLHHDHLHHDHLHQDHQQSETASHEATSVDLLQGDEEAQAVLEEARRRARENKDLSNDDAASDASGPSARARRIAAIRAKIEAERADTQRNYEINRCLSKAGQVIDHDLPALEPSNATAISNTNFNLKTLGVVGLTVLAVILVVYSAYAALGSAEPPVVPGID